MAESKISKTPRSSNKKPQTKPIASKKPLVSESTPEQLKGLNFYALDKECRKVVMRDVLLSVTSEYTSTCPSPKDCLGDDDFLIGNQGIMTISNALLNLCFGKKYIRRKSWSGTFISVCNGVLYIHSHANDPLGREWRPTFEDLTQKDWECLEVEMYQLRSLIQKASSH